MSKFVIPFNNPAYWQNSNNCSICDDINKLYNRIINSKDAVEQARLIEFLEQDLVDGYEVLHVFEKNGYILYDKSALNKLKSYTSNSEDFINYVNKVLYGFNTGSIANCDIPVLIHSRWCKNCGSRKPNIYDTERK